MMYKFTLKKKGNYYRQDTYEFNLPSGHTCPFARDCKIMVDRESGKFNILGKGFRCYAAISERFPGVRKSRRDNYDWIMQGNRIEIPKKATHIRIHASGDFFSQDYFDMWLDIARENPSVMFWAFTKSIQYLFNRQDEIPDNMNITCSIGSLQDDITNKYGFKYAKVFNSEKEAIDSGLPIDNDDWHAQQGDYSFALINNFSKKNKV